MWLLWNVSLRSPAEVWWEHETLLVGEFVSLACGCATLLHAARLGARPLAVWTAAFLAALFAEAVRSSSESGNYLWHARATFGLRGNVTPLYWPVLSAVVFYVSWMAVARVQLRPLTRAAGVGLLSALTMVPLQLVGSANLWWTWHDTDPAYVERLMGLYPWADLVRCSGAATCLSLVMDVGLAALGEGWVRAVRRSFRPPSYSLDYRAEMLAAFVAAALSVPAGGLAIALLHHLPRGTLRISSEVCASLALAGLAVVVWFAERRRLEPNYVPVDLTPLGSPVHSPGSAGRSLRHSASVATVGHGILSVPLHVTGPTGKLRASVSMPSSTAASPERDEERRLSPSLLQATPPAPPPPPPPPAASTASRDSGGNEENSRAAPVSNSSSSSSLRSEQRADLRSEDSDRPDGSHSDDEDRLLLLRKNGDIGVPEAIPEGSEAGDQTQPRRTPPRHRATKSTSGEELQLSGLRQSSSVGSGPKSRRRSSQQMQGPGVDARLRDMFRPLGAPAPPADPSLQEGTWRTAPASWSADKVFVSLAALLAMVVLVAVVGSPEDVRATGPHQPSGSLECSEPLVAVAVPGAVWAKRAVLCASKLAHPEPYDFRCVAQVPTNAAWYTICGRRGQNPAEFVAVTVSFCAVAFVVFRHLLRSGAHDVDHIPGRPAPLGVISKRD